MSASPLREARMSEPLPCPECGAMQMACTVENCRTEDGLTVRRLRHLKCHACGARFFDDAAMHRWFEQRTKEERWPPVDPQGQLAIDADGPEPTVPDNKSDAGA